MTLKTCTTWRFGPGPSRKKLRIPTSFHLFTTRCHKPCSTFKLTIGTKHEHLGSLEFIESEQGHEAYPAKVVVGFVGLERDK